eukprot:6079417-Ditylum_brightwellii.AAC.1
MRNNDYSGQKELAQAHQYALLLHGAIKLQSLERCRAGWLQNSAVLLHGWCWKMENAKLDSSSIGHSISVMGVWIKRLKEATTFFHNCV